MLVYSNFYEPRLSERSFAA